MLNIIFINTRPFVWPRITSTKQSPPIKKRRYHTPHPQSEETAGPTSTTSTPGTLDTRRSSKGKAIKNRDIFLSDYNNAMYSIISKV